MRLTRSASHRLRLKKKKSISRFWGLASLRRSQQKMTFRVKRQQQARVHAEYVVLATHRQAEEQFKLVA
ncbi:hypothetical protein VV869_00850 [Photobacterium sp. MCCC 1A19761]|uniref:hypothetical protein n=1 Tax=Photobacterium sp. MCCC 1A19761 TaxID=3115000 RepID=UPI00307D00A3